MHSFVPLALLLLNATPDDMRLIRTAEGTRWMSPAEIQTLVERSHQEGHCGGFMDVTTHPESATPRVEPWALAERKPKHMAIVNPILPTLSSKNIVETVRALSAMHDRYYDGPGGEAGAQWILEAFKHYAKGRSDITVETFNHDFRQPSVIARIPGKGSHAHEKVILGAHEDSVNWEDGLQRGRSRAPGADDNASGVAVLLEVFRALVDANYHPHRTIEFMAYAGEELGLLGSQDIAEAYRSAKEDVVAVLQMDMTMYPSKSHKLTLVVDNISRPLTDFTEKLIDTYVKAPYQETRCGYACSDHASWDQAGYPAVFPFESSFHEANPEVHTVRDTLENKMDGEFGLQFAKLNTAFAVEMSE